MFSVRSLYTMLKTILTKFRVRFSYVKSLDTFRFVPSSAYGGIYPALYRAQKVPDDSLPVPDGKCDAVIKSSLDIARKR
jgi:hypothetical protein